ncbi:hypothetical protein GMORB2_1438 [Geosmithia morbida]|uniref:Uncharacterized protein n=1 Tax=Geosmithia morbida TaxID=1094350 RepID=A0A9P4Z138_9HYPO|nr:uncharacterized protein GMORB2_1438 [Geosmithia morbida]KAF4126192.1 hypothetical protein GMORB2_1438 [Geosmithia morbida]
MLAATAAKCASLLPDDDEVRATGARLKQDVLPVIYAMLASIPFFLIDDVEGALIRSDRILPGPSAGGLLAMYPLYLVRMQKSVITSDIGRHIRGCLSWIGHWQGIGQAKVLARNEEDMSSVASAHTVVWAAMAV